MMERSDCGCSQRAFLQTTASEDLGLREMAKLSLGNTEWLLNNMDSDPEFTFKVDLKSADHRPLLTVYVKEVKNS